MSPSAGVTFQQPKTKGKGSVRPIGPARALGYFEIDPSRVAQTAIYVWQRVVTVRELESTGGAVFRPAITINFVWHRWVDRGAVYSKNGKNGS